MPMVEMLPNKVALAESSNATMRVNASKNAYHSPEGNHQPEEVEPKPFINNKMQEALCAPFIMDRIYISSCMITNACGILFHHFTTRERYQTV